MEYQLKQLPIPANALRDERAIELVRVWAANGAQHVSISTSLWKDPAAWGIMLVDLAKHISRSYQQTNAMSYEAALLRVKEGFEAEWNCETDQPTGQILTPKDVGQRNQD